MATLLELNHAQALFKLDPQLEPNEQEWRAIYLSPRLLDWLRDVLPTLKATWESEIDCVQQLDGLVEVFCSGETLCYTSQFHPIAHVKDGIWMLKTGDLRIFGWFHVKDCFIGWRAELADHVKKHDLYHGLAGETAHFRDSLPLDTPRFVPGANPNDVISNYSFS